MVRLAHPRLRVNEFLKVVFRRDRVKLPQATRFAQRARHRSNPPPSTYARPRLWITFWRRFWGVFLGGFLEATGPGASVRGVFSADGGLLVRWASGNFDFFGGFFLFLVRFLPVFVPYFALFPSMSCACLYVYNLLAVNVSGFRTVNLALLKKQCLRASAWVTG